jgi:hypothetical protein
LAHISILETQRRVEEKISTKYLERSARGPFEAITCQGWHTSMMLWPRCITVYQWVSWKHTFALRPFHLCIYLLSNNVSSYLFFWKLRLSRAFFKMHKRMRLQDHSEEIVSPISDSSFVMSSPLSSAREFEFLDQGTLLNQEHVEAHSKTWS